MRKLDTLHIQRVADTIRDMLGDDFDEQTFADTLEGETDVMEVLGWLIKQRGEADAFAEACKEHAKEYANRAARLAIKSQAMTRAMGDILDAVGERKLAHPLGTVSRTKGRENVRIIDEAEIPSQLCKVVSSPDKAAIKAQLQAGELVPGAIMETSPDGVSLRVK